MGAEHEYGVDYDAFDVEHVSSVTSDGFTTDSYHIDTNYSVPDNFYNINVWIDTKMDNQPHGGNIPITIIVDTDYSHGEYYPVVKNDTIRSVDYTTEKTIKQGQLSIIDTNHDEVISDLEMLNYLNYEYDDADYDEFYEDVTSGITSRDDFTIDQVFSIESDDGFMDSKVNTPGDYQIVVHDFYYPYDHNEYVSTIHVEPLIPKLDGDLTIYTQMNSDKIYSTQDLTGMEDFSGFRVDMGYSGCDSSNDCQTLWDYPLTKKGTYNGKAYTTIPLPTNDVDNKSSNFDDYIEAEFLGVEYQGKTVK